jgi:hypothetical protein
MTNSHEGFRPAAGRLQSTHCGLLNDDVIDDVRGKEEDAEDVN